MYTYTSALNNYIGPMLPSTAMSCSTCSAIGIGEAVPTAIEPERVQTQLVGTLADVSRGTLEVTVKVDVDVVV